MRTLLAFLFVRREFEDTAKVLRAAGIKPQ